jgi:hypothetical protein
MTINTIDNSQRTAAKVAGLSCLLTMAIVVFANYGLLNPLIVPGNPAETARNIVAHERQFRITVTCFLIYSAGVVCPVRARQLSTFCDSIARLVKSNVDYFALWTPRCSSDFRSGFV